MSPYSSEMRRAAPPAAGIVHRPPCKSIAVVRLSGDTAMAIEVPSWTVTSIGPSVGGWAGRTVVTAANTIADITNRRMSHLATASWSARVAYNTIGDRPLLSVELPLRRLYDAPHRETGAPRHGTLEG